MPRQRKEKGGRLRMVYLLLVAGSLSSGGCLVVAAAGAAGAGAATYVYIKGKVCQDYPASFPDAWAAVQKALQDEGFPLVSNENDGKSGKITTRTTDGTTITIDLEVISSRVPAEGSLTRVCVRVGLLGDAPLSERLLSRIASHLAPPSTPPATVPTTGGPGPTWTPAPGSGPIRPVAAPGSPETAEPPGALPREPAPIK
jgi:hypothetical protein